MRFAGTWKIYSKSASPQLARITSHNAWLLNLRWPYQARFINTFEKTSRVIVFMQRSAAEERRQAGSSRTFRGASWSGQCCAARAGVTVAQLSKLLAQDVAPRARGVTIGTMNPPEERTLVRTSLLSAEAVIGLGITIGAIGLLVLLLGWAQYMREVREAAFILLPLGAFLLVVGGIVTFLGHSRKQR